MSIARKLRLKPGMKIRVIHPPKDYADADPLLEGAGKTVKSPDQIHWFVKDSKVLKAELQGVLDLMGNDTLLWTFYPKKSSGIETDLTRDHGWDVLMVQNLTFLSMVSFNDTWTAFACRKPNETDVKKKLKPVEDYGAYIDPVKRTMKYPDDMEAVLAENPVASAFLAGLSFTNRKEYLVWILSAKRAETRQQRLVQMIDKLRKGRKNPAEKD